MTNRKTIYIFRHGETDWNREGRIQGNTDIPLNELGREQARRLKKFFAENPVDVFISSDLSRAHETALIASGLEPHQVKTDRRLRETDMGDAEGMTDAEFVTAYGDLLERWRDLKQIDVRFPNGESKIEHVNRLLEGLEEYLRSTEHEKIAVASHGGALRRLIHHMLPELETPAMVGNCFVFKFTYDIASGVWTAEAEPICRALE